LRRTPARRRGTSAGGCQTASAATATPALRREGGAAEAAGAARARAGRREADGVCVAAAVDRPAAHLVVTVRGTVRGDARHSEQDTVGHGAREQVREAMRDTVAGGGAVHLVAVGMVGMVVRAAAVARTLAAAAMAAAGGAAEAAGGAAAATATAAAATARRGGWLSRRKTRARARSRRAAPSHRTEAHSRVSQSPHRRRPAEGCWDSGAGLAGRVAPLHVTQAQRASLQPPISATLICRPPRRRLRTRVPLTAVFV
jgi:hypothetical protein